MKQKNNRPITGIVDVSFLSLYSSTICAVCRYNFLDLMLFLSFTVNNTRSTDNTYFN